MLVFQGLLAFAVKFRFIVRMMNYSNFCISRKQAGRMTEPWPFFTLGASHCGEVVCSFSMVPEMQSCQRPCQRCGYKRKQTDVGKIKAAGVDLDKIDLRLQQLTNFDRATSYSKQKDSLQKERENFLAATPGKSSLATMTPRDLCRFRIFLGERHGQNTSAS